MSAQKKATKKKPAKALTCGDENGRGCGNPATTEHECPFASEIHNDATPCTCCDDCAHECAMDI